MQYRVRLLTHPIVIYNGRSFKLASMHMDALTCDRVMERQMADGWRAVVSVENER